MESIVTASAEYALTTLEISNFRAFRRVLFPKLGRVNLIVGKNNAGKTTLLEALRLYAEGGAMSTVEELLESRDLLDFGVKSSRDNLERLETALEQLFNQQGDRFAGQLAIGPRSGGPELMIEWVAVDSSADSAAQQPLFSDEDASLIGEPALRVKVGDRRAITVPLSRFDASRRWRGWIEVLPSTMIEADGIPRSDLGEMWDSVALTDLEDLVLDALRLIEPDVERLSFVANADGYERVPVVKLRGFSRPVPLRTLGDGMYRMLALALGLVNARQGLLLADEVENGLHYSVQRQMWRLVFEMAARLNVQVFATTHSWDCIEAFQAVANSLSEIEGMVHRVERKTDGAVKVVDISEEELGIATENHIEIR